MFNLSSVNEAEEKARTLLMECFGGKCIDDQDDFAIECECDSWVKWVVAVRSPTLCVCVHWRSINRQQQYHQSG